MAIVVTLSKTYSIVTPESACIGDAAEHGFEYEREDFSVRDAIDELSRCVELSSHPVRSPECALGVWASTEPETDYRTADERTESVHIVAINGHEPTAMQSWRLLRAAGLIPR
jgi:hypothetical protein